MNRFYAIEFVVQPEHKSLQVEHMEYESTQFFSDIGGAAGLILGVSLNAFFGIAGDFQISSQDLQ